MARPVPADDPCRRAADEIRQRRQAANTVEDARAVVELAKQALRQCPTNWAVKSALAYAIHKAEIQLPASVGNVEVATLVAAVDRIRDCMAHGPYHSSSVFVTAVSDAVKALLKLGTPRSKQEAIRLVLQVDTAQVSRERTEPYPSHAEKFFLAASSALDTDRQQRDALIACCRAALAPGVFKSPSDSRWVTFRLAKALEEGSPEEALALLDELPRDAREEGMTSLYLRLLRRAGRDSEALAIAKSHVKQLDFGKMEFAHGILLDLLELLPGGRPQRSLAIFLQHYGLSKRRAGVDSRVNALAASLALPAATAVSDAKLVVMLNNVKDDL